MTLNPFFSENTYLSEIILGRFFFEYFSPFLKPFKVVSILGRTMESGNGWVIPVQIISSKELSMGVFALFFFCLPNGLLFCWFVGVFFFSNNKYLLKAWFTRLFWYPFFLKSYMWLSLLYLHHSCVCWCHHEVFSGNETTSFIFHVHENILIKFGMNQITAWLFPV